MIVGIDSDSQLQLELDYLLLNPYEKLPNPPFYTPLKPLANFPTIPPFLPPISPLANLPAIATFLPAKSPPISNGIIYFLGNFPLCLRDQLYLLFWTKSYT